MAFVPGFKRIDFRRSVFTPRKRMFARSPSLNDRLIKSIECLVAGENKEEYFVAFVEITYDDDKTEWFSDLRIRKKSFDEEAIP